ncbi:MAG: hypothetical protein A2289_13330 [Deltaproteobacteria bacterium RIFOXYA12_FULL_58_15]|nr:MAG: hypothetical protein A2289_13330 [Deltaproteobacteria bacterium RIFOXYA12_FULL_58_15]OGR13834.1 MAG: hypothetical protein A2341_01440 [Deltaproteobacteria bacterium RIFOXYB12_FULL_58_9]
MRNRGWSNRRTRFLAGAGAGVGLLLLLVYLAPGAICRLVPLGDEGEGECLGWTARLPLAPTCKVLDVTSKEIATTGNDVVISEALGGLVRAGACEELAAFRREYVASKTQAYINDMLDGALASCVRGEEYSLQDKRAQSQILEADLVDRLATNSRCQSSVAKPSQR